MINDKEILIAVCEILEHELESEKEHCWCTLQERLRYEAGLEAKVLNTGYMNSQEIDIDYSIGRFGLVYLYRIMETDLDFDYGKPISRKMVKWLKELDKKYEKIYDDILAMLVEADKCNSLLSDDNKFVQRIKDKWNEKLAFSCVLWFMDDAC